VDAEFFLVATGAIALLVETRTGYQNLCRLVTRYKLREKEKGTGTATLEEIAETRGRTGVLDRRRGGCAGRFAFQQGL